MTPPSGSFGAAPATVACADALTGEGRIHWRRSIAWLLLLGPFFFLSYGYANAIAADRGVTDAFFHSWERHIPFWAWTIVPYWSIDLLYGLSFLPCRTPGTVDRHALRLLTVQIVSVACFLLFPLRFAFERPPVEGFFGAMFDVLTSFDQPYNQAPSLHIGALVVIWVRFALGSRGMARGLVHLWMGLIALSVLTTWQHHFTDVPTGALVGLLSVWAWPDHGPSPLAGWRPARSPVRRRLALLYLGGAMAAAAIAWSAGGAVLWLLWPAVALALVAMCYVGPGARGFQKDRHGRQGAVAWLFAPYTVGAWINSRLWTRNRPRADRVADGVWLGRMPCAADMRAGGFGGLCDLTAELPAPRGPWRYVCLPWLDLVAPNARVLRDAASQIERLRPHGEVLVCCALGYSRSASAVAAWLLLGGRADGVDAAISIVQRARPGVVFGPAHRAALTACLARTTEAPDNG